MPEPTSEMFMHYSQSTGRDCELWLESKLMSLLPSDESLWLGRKEYFLGDVSMLDTRLSSLYDLRDRPMMLGKGRLEPA